jgi:DNA-directed RNA polymerase subunit RPC12/RpoP
MARILKCPRCQAQIDATNLSAGSTVRCADCGAVVRISTGNTSVRTKSVNPPSAVPVANPAPGAKVPVVVAAPPQQAAPVRSRSSRGTDVRRGSPTRVIRKESNTGLVIGAVVGAAVLVIVLVAVMAGKGEPKKPPAQRGDEEVASGSSMSMPAPIPAAASPGQPVPVAADAAKPMVIKVPDDPGRVDWPTWMQYLRVAGGFDDPSRPEGQIYQRIKTMGKPAYPHLVKFIDHEDPMLGKAAVKVLNELTGQNKPLPNENTKGKAKEEWDAWVKANP